MNSIYIISFVFITAVTGASGADDSVTDARLSLPASKAGRFDERQKLIGAVKPDPAVEVGQIYSSRQGEPHTVRFTEKGSVEIITPRRTGTDSDKPVGDAKVTFYSFKARPAIDLTGAGKSTFDLGGAVIGFSRLDGVEGATMGELLVWNAARDAAEKGEWVRAGVYFGLNEDGTCADCNDLAVRSDEATAGWDLYVNGKMWLAGIHYTPGNPEKVVITSESDKESGIEQLVVSMVNPLFPDQDSDGIDDAFEQQLGFDNTRHDRDSKLSGDEEATLLDYFIQAPRQRLRKTVTREPGTTKGTRQVSLE